jgi:exonuclease VII small subunit
VHAIKVVNDNAGRGVALIKEYSGFLTKNEQQLQFLLQVVEEHR